MTFSSIRAPRCGCVLRISNASSTNFPRTKSATGRTFRGLIRAYRCDALNMIMISKMNGQRPRAVSLSMGTRPKTQSLFSLRVTLEGPGQCKLTQLMPHHFFADKHFDMLSSIVNHKRVSDEFRHNRASARPGLNRLLRIVRNCFLNFFEELDVDVRTLFLRSAHNWFFCFLFFSQTQPTGVIRQLQPPSTMVI